MVVLPFAKIEIYSLFEGLDRLVGRLESRVCEGYQINWSREREVAER